MEQSKSAESNDEAKTANADVTETKQEIKPPTYEELMQRLTALESTNARLLNESKKHKAAAQDWQGKLQEREKTELEKQGQFKELAERRLKETQELQAKLEEMKNQTIRERVKSAVNTEASKLGCVDFEALMALGNSELLQYDEETGAIIGMKEFIEDTKAKKPWLFSSKPTASINPMLPRGGIVGKSLTAKDLAKMSIQDRTEYMIGLAKK